MVTDGEERSGLVRSHWPFLVLLATFMFAALWLSFRLPAFSTPNEVLHYEYVALVIQEKKLPDPSLSLRLNERHQPPAYYLLVSLVSSPLPTPPLDSSFVVNPFRLSTIDGNHNPYLHTNVETVPVLYAGRLISTLLGTAALIAFYAASIQTLSRSTSLFVVALMGFQPMFLYLSASLSNDLAVAATATFVLAYTTFLITKKWQPRAYIIWGVLYALALFTKASAVFLILLLFIACLARWKATGRPRVALNSGLAALVGFVPLYSIWFIFSQIYRPDTLDVSTIVPLSRIINLGISDIGAMRPYLLRLWKSFWLDWSAGETGYTSDTLYILGGFVLLLLMAGWVRRPPRTWNNKILASMHIIWPLPLIAIFIGVKTLMVKEVGILVPEGRWLLPILPSLAWLAGNGWSRWWSPRRRPAANALAAGFAVISTLVLMVIFIPRANPLPKKLADLDQIPDDAEPVGIVFDNQISLSAVQSNEFVNNRDATVEYYWYAEDNIEKDFSVVSILVTELADDWQIVDRRQTHPGNGLAPTNGWEQGELYADQITLHPGLELHGPILVSLVVEVIDGDMPLEAALDGRTIDTPIVKQIVIRPEESLLPEKEALLEYPVNYGDLFDLIGLSVSVVDDELSASLWWESNASPNSDYTVFIHLLNEKGELLAQSDSMPNRNLSPTHIWESGDIIQDVHVLSFTSAPGAKIRIGVYDPSTLNRLAASQDGKRLEDDTYGHHLP